MAKYDLQKFRRERNMTQIQLAKALGVSQGFLSGMETGRNPFPDERRKNFTEAFPDVDLEAYLLPDKEPVKVVETIYEDEEAAREGINQRIHHVFTESAQKRRETEQEYEKLEHLKSPEFNKYLEQVVFRFGENIDVDVPSIREAIAEVLEESDNNRKWNEELRDKNDTLREKADGLREQLDKTRDDLFQAQQEIIRLKELLLSNQIKY